MQIESLKVFCDLAETESFTKAAQINQVTQSAVSQQISSLERQFKSLLIERSKKKFRLTREGQVLYEYSKQIIQTFEALHSRLRASVRSRDERLRANLHRPERVRAERLLHTAGRRRQLQGSDAAIYCSLGRAG